MDSMFERLMTLPLFRGVTQERMAEIVGMARFHFLKYLPGGEFIKAGDSCTHLKFILSGSARITTSNADGRFKVSQTLMAPDVICPDFLFGRATTYPCTAVAIDTANILQVEKSDYLRILTSDAVFMFNYLNHLATNAQKTVDGVLSITMGNIEERIALWVVCLTQPSAVDITLEARQRDLCTVFGVQRNSFVAALQGMADRGLITFAPNVINIIDRRAIAATLPVARDTD